MDLTKSCIFGDSKNSIKKLKDLLTTSTLYRDNFETKAIFKNAMDNIRNEFIARNYDESFKNEYFMMISSLGFTNKLVLKYEDFSCPVPFSLTCKFEL